jgi:hypothetical protein
MRTSNVSAENKPPQPDGPLTIYGRPQKQYRRKRAVPSKAKKDDPALGTATAGTNDLPPEKVSAPPLAAIEPEVASTFAVEATPSLPEVSSEGAAPTEGVVGATQDIEMADNPAPPGASSQPETVVANDESLIDPEIEFDFGTWDELGMTQDEIWDAVGMPMGEWLGYDD